MADRTIPVYDRATNTYINVLYHDNANGTFSPTTTLNASGMVIGDVDIATIAAGETHIGEIGYKTTTVQIEFTRENNATPYGIGDVISGSAGTPLVYELANIMRVNGGNGYVTNIMVEFNVKSVVPTLRLNFFNASNPTVSGDNLPHKEVYADVAKRLGYIDLPAMTTAADTANSDTSRTIGALGLANFPTIPVKAASNSRSLWISLQTLLAVTLTASSKVTVTVTVDSN